MTSFSNSPNPQFERKNWLSLNGEWDFGFQKAKHSYKFSKDAGFACDIHKKSEYDYKINVPFCVESKLSGIGYTGFINYVWYRKKVNFHAEGKLVFLNIGAADYLTTVLINGKCAGRHKGGYTSFKFNITDYIKDGENEIFILCEDEVRDPYVPAGKQSDRKNSYACSYTRTTGIWGNVYLEFIPENHIESFKIYPDEKQCCCDISFKLKGCAQLTVKAFYEDTEVGSKTIPDAAGNININIPLSEKHLWECLHGRLYRLEMTFGEDTVYSYFGLRNVRLEGFKFLLNSKSVFQRLVLDQGYYREGIYTAKDDDELKRDIELSLALGFNGARLHQKVFDPRFLYYCDLYGYIVWGEYASWGLDYSNKGALAEFLPQWLESVERDFNHPSIIGWCPFNETWNYHGRKQRNELIETVYEMTKLADSTRPCIDTSGNFHVKTDIYDVHDYRFKADEFKKSYDMLKDGILYEHVLNDNPGRQKYGGEPVFISEYGGIKWEADTSVKSWGYGDDVKSEEELAERYAGLTQAITSNPKILGFCYTQLYDVEQEQNGLYTYDRKKKFSDDIYEKIKAANTSKAAIENE